MWSVYILGCFLSPFHFSNNTHIWERQRKREREGKEEGEGEGEGEREREGEGEKG